jgi:hypothetical protein
MFETALLRKHGQGFNSIDVGLIAETLLFYSNIHLVAHFGILMELLRTIGGDTLLRLLENTFITFTYLRTDFGTFTSNQNGVELYEFITHYLSGSAAGKKRLSTRDSIYVAFERALGKSRRTQILATKFLHHVKILPEITISDQPGGINIIDLANADLDDPSYVKESIKSALTALVPSYNPPQTFRFGILRSSKGFIIDHNLELDLINGIFRKHFPTSGVVLTPALLINQLLEARVDLTLTSRYLAELVTNPAPASIVRQRLAAVMTKRDKSVSEMEIFQSTQLHDARAIREAINSGEHTFDEFMSVLDKATRFKEWLRATNPDGLLLDEYYKSVMAETWLNELPAKTVRFFLALGIGAVIEALFPSGLGATTGIALEAADHLLLDQLLRGWRPNQFVEGPLQDLGSYVSAT